MSQIITKFIQDNAVTGAKMRLNNNETARARNQANTADVDLYKLTTGNVWELQTQPTAASALPIPSAPKEYTTVEYVQNYVMGKTDAKDAVNLLQSTNLALTGVAPLTIDGVTVTSGMRIALTGQTTGTENGVYVATIVALTYSMARATDFDQVNDASGKEVTTGAYFKVISGTVYSGWEAILTTADPVQIGVSSIDFAANPTIQALTAGDMLRKTGNDFSLDTATNGGLESTNPGNATGQVRVKTDTAALEKDQTTRRDPTTGAVVARKSKKQPFTLTPTDITNQYVDLPDVAGTGSVVFTAVGGGDQVETDDYTINYTGGVSSKTRITFAGGLANGGVSALVTGDKLVIGYTSF